MFVGMETKNDWFSFSCNTICHPDWHTYSGDSPEGEYKGVRGAIQIVASSTSLLLHLCMLLLTNVYN
jgi:hypothetical protein